MLVNKINADISNDVNGDIGTLKILDKIMQEPVLVQIQQTDVHVISGNQTGLRKAYRTGLIGEKINRNVEYESKGLRFMMYGG